MLAEFRNPVSIITKNHLVVRDIDVFLRLAAFDGVVVNVSVTSLDDHLAGVLEPQPLALAGDWTPSSALPPPACR